MHEVKIVAQTNLCLVVVSGTVYYQCVIQFFDAFRAWQTTLEYVAVA